ncbi:hypothetical protein ACFYVR_20715 [Rhodococcus sp. NPDC003318]|uniref:hypothetical protein n=1 Tax=Rhodococcus sp. NPDC003318 TaxID=3364503 RepID=UPI0036B610C5
MSAPDPTQRLALMRAFAQSYRDRQFLAEHYDLADGYLQTTLSDDSRMPLTFFVEYNNAWWFEIVTAVAVPAVGYDPDSDTGFIVLDIEYDTDVLRAMQHVHFGGDVINRIRTYAAGAFFTLPRPLVELDSHGNRFWLETGYHLRPSAEAARDFLDSESGRRFADDEPTATPVSRIRRNLDELLGRI